MSEFETDMEQAWDESLSEEQAREAAAGNLVPRGKWEGQIHSFTSEVVKSREDAEHPHPLDGKRVARVRVTLYTEEGEKVYFFDACPASVKATSKKGGSYVPAACQNAGFLYQATKQYGKPFPDVLQYAMEHRLIYDIGVKKATDEWPAQNTLRGISAPKEA